MSTAEGMILVNLGSLIGFIHGTHTDLRVVVDTLF